jgi:hypothetical protein
MDDMSRYAVIDSANTVVNVIEAPSGWTIAGKTLVASDTAQKRDTWDGSAFTTPVVSVPATLQEQYAALSTATARISFIAQQMGLEIAEA